METALIIEDDPTMLTDCGTFRIQRLQGCDRGRRREGFECRAERQA